MTPYDVLKKMQKFTVDNIAAFIRLRKEVDLSGDVFDNTECKIEFVNPYVEIGTIPHKNFQPLSFQSPMILWTIDAVDDDGTYESGRVLNLRAYVSTYGGNIYKTVDGEETKLPDNKAYLDMLNLLEVMYQKISSKMNIDGVALNKPVSYGIYDGAFYPYCYGYFTIQAEIPSVEYSNGHKQIEYTDIEQFL